MRILVVEDEPKVARCLERGLRQQSYAVDVADDHEYDLIVLDVMLPKRNGFEVLRELRAAAPGRDGGTVANYLRALRDESR